MLASSNIAMNAATYELLADIAIHGNDLEMATLMSLKMEKETGSKLPQEMLNKMLDLYVTPEQKSTDQAKKPSSRADTVKDEMVAILTKNPWFGSAKGQPQ